jgi:cytochrome P450
MLLAAVDPDGEGAMDDAQLRDEAITIFLAGFETVANGLTWLWYALATNPEAETELHAELDAAAGQGGRTLPYTEMVVKETLRLYSPIWAFNRAPTADIELGGWRIGRGEIVLISPPVLHMNPKYYDEPERFWPARFGREGSQPAPRGAYLPFGAGPHVCIGAQLATLTMGLVVGTLARQFRVELLPGQTVERATLVSMCPKEPIRARLVRRAPRASAS